MPIELVNTFDITKDEWHEWRNRGIGGSDATCICGLNKYKSIVELCLEKTGQAEHKEPGEVAYWGTVLEPIVREEFTKRSNLKVRREPFMLQHPEYKFMLANIDGIVMDPIYGDCLFEAKTASQYKQEEWAEEYILQVQHYMAAAGYNAAYVAVLIGGKQFKYKYIKRDNDLIEILIKLERKFWRYVETNTVPPLDGTEVSSKLLDLLYPDSKSTDMIQLSPEAEQLILNYQNATQEEKQALYKKEEAINRLKAILGDNECGTINGKTVDWRSISTERFDSKKFQAEMPDIYPKFLLKSYFRRFSIKSS